MQPKTQQSRFGFNSRRFDLFYGVLLVVVSIFLIRLFYVQVIQHGHYHKMALAGQFKQYEVPADRGVIEAHDGDNIVPIVLNEDKYTLFADPHFITEPDSTAQTLAKITGEKTEEYSEKMSQESRYVILAKKLSSDKKEEIEKLELKGVGLREEPIRAYPQGNMAAQLLGFVNDEGVGTYGIEQYLNKELAGKPGELKAITDASGVPLIAVGDNVRREPEAGKRITLTIDVGIQKKVEQLLKDHLPSVRSKAGNVVVMDPNTGAVKAMASWPTYDPAKFYEVKDASIFTNPTVSAPFEVGSIMKTLTVAAGLDHGSIKSNTTFYDPSSYKIDGATVKNVEEDGGPGTKSIADLLRLSLNTGATYTLMQMGGGEINEKARKTWHDYMTNKFRFGQTTGIEQGYEGEGSVPSPTEGFGLNLQYANTTFGQGITVTPLQMAAAFSATVNGGKYYRPHLVEPADGKSDVLNNNVVSDSVSAQIRKLHENTINQAYATVARDGYKIGGKTGTAEIPNPSGGYYGDRYNGTFIGYVGGNKPEYVIMVSIIEPVVPGYAGRMAASPLFGKVSNMLIDNFSVRTSSR